jgi:site-specific DNA-methyltransferase (adenine-specific)
MELEENVRRVDLTWQEKAQATSQLFELRRLQAEKAGAPEPTVGDLAKEINATTDNSASGGAYTAVREDIILSRHLKDPDIAKASSAKEAVKILKRKEESRRHAELGVSVGATFSSSDHTLLKGDCLISMANLQPESFDVILTDPPYGMDAQDFGDSGGKTTGGHFYDDSYQNWLPLLRGFADQSYRLAKAQSHAYVFCDIDRFGELKVFMSAAGWRVFRTPILWINPSSFRAPWPESGPQRKYQLCLYATKGDRRVTKLYPDYIMSTTDENLGHPAQKPVGVYSDLLSRSARPGDTVLDPFCGSGTIFPAAHKVLCKATGIEMDPAAYGLAAKRLESLK